MIAEYRPPGRAKFFTEALLEVRGDSSAPKQPPDIVEMRHLAAAASGKSVRRHYAVPGAGRRLRGGWWLKPISAS